MPGRPPQVGRSNLEAWGQTVNGNPTPRTGCVGHGRQTTMPTGTTGIFSLTNWYLCRDEAPSRSGVARAASVVTSLHEATEWLASTPPPPSSSTPGRMAWLTWRAR